MHPDLKNVSEHIHSLGLGILSQAQRNTFYSDLGYEVALDEGVFAVLQAAQAAELLIKAAIAEQHPLLIFSSLPKSKSANGSMLNIEHLLDSAKTLQYSELPEVLWAATGYKIPDLATYNSFGKLRNCIQHFALPNKNLREESSAFIYKVIDPILEHFWGEYAVEHVDLEEHESDIFELLQAHGLKVRFPEKYKKYADVVE